MNASELVASLRDGHHRTGFDGSCGDPDCCGFPMTAQEANECLACGEQMPCLSSIAADRIEAALAVLYDPPVPSRMLIPVVRATLNGGAE